MYDLYGRAKFCHFFLDKDDLINDLFLLECFNKPSEWLF